MKELDENLDFSQYSISKEDFALVQSDKRITDTKLESKPTTFLKDALRRFRKNKSSIAGAIILGILVLLAIFLPVISQSNIDPNKPSVSEKFLAPKLFNKGTGFWDGTRKYSGIVYDVAGEVPAGYYKEAVFNLVVDKNPTYINQANKYASGGYFHFVNEVTNSSSTDEDGIRYLASSETTFTAAGNYKVDIDLYSEAGINSGILGEYQVYLRYTDSLDGSIHKIILKNWSKEYSALSLNISDALKKEGLDSLTARLAFDLKAGNEQSSYILIKKCVFTSADGNEDLVKLSINDATKSILYTKDEETNKFPLGYWSCTGEKKIYKSEIYYCSFSYDTYEGAYGITKKDVAYSDLTRYISYGWCKYDSKVGPSSFQKLSDKCPIEKIYSQTEGKTGITNLSCDVCRYKEYGYSSMPRFLFGTDSNGHDIVKKSFAGLRTSLILGFCTAAFCLAFGLCWGAISGYFGGNVDLAMERFCDILGGVPWIVVMTLCILHLGNNFFTFFLALCLTGWMGVAGRTRTQFYRFKGREYILASRTLGASDLRLIFKHILPNALGTIVTSCVLMIPSTIFSEATLAYLNLGLQGMQSFGVMLSNNQQYLSIYPNLILFPATIMALMMISFNLFGNGLRDALNPSLKGSD